MEERILNELQELKELTLLSAKTALTMKDACALTGLSMSHLYRLVCNKQIPYYKGAGGKLTYFNKEELTAWLLARKVPTAAEAEQAAIKYVVDNGRAKYVLSNGGRAKV